MSPEIIKSKLQERGYSQGALSRKWKVPIATVNALVNRKFRSKRLEKRLARFLGVTPEELRQS